MNAARHFMRREEYQPKTTPADSPFRRFMVSCVKCGSFKLRVMRFRMHHDDGFASNCVLRC
jgi:hypothetical protein